MINNAIAFPARQVSGQEPSAAALDLPGPRIWKPRHLAEFLGLSVHWVYKRTEKNADDPIPRIPGVGRLSFDTHSPAFQAWIARQLGCVDSEGGDE